MSKLLAKNFLPTTYRSFQKANDKYARDSREEERRPDVLPVAPNVQTDAADHDQQTIYSPYPFDFSSRDHFLNRFCSISASTSSSK